MNKKDTPYKCRICGSINTIGNIHCWKCDALGEIKHGNDTNLLPETQLEPETARVSRLERSPAPRFPCLTPAFRWASMHIETRKRWITLLSILIAVVILLSTFGSEVINQLRFQPMPTPSVPTVIGSDGIGVILVAGEYIGISDGRYALDINRDAGPLVLEASESLRNGNRGNALAEWNAAHEKDTNDAEPLIYAEDQRVLTSGSPYITIVLGVSLGGNGYNSFSRDFLQGAYIIQKECNANPRLSGGKKLRLLIASSGSNPDRTKDIAKQIVRAAQFDKTIVGVQGWVNSLTTLNAVKILVSAHLPLVASNSISDELTGISPYFFRVSVPNILQIPLITTYVENKVTPQRLVVFRDHTEPYSRSLADDFAQQFTKDGYKIASIEDFKTADEVGLAQHVQKVLTTYKPDFLFIPTNMVGDVTTVLKTIPATAEYADLKVFTGNSGYELVQTGKKIDGYTHMLFSTSAFPDEWSILGSGNQKPPFFNDYSAAYDPHDQYIDSPYTYRRADSVAMLAYDALYTILAGSRMTIQQGKQDPVPEDIKNALSQINGSQSFQGITGAISFGPDGNPINKVHLILRVVDGQYLHVAAYQGCFLVNSECDNDIHILE